MGVENFRVSGFSDKDFERISTNLSRLLPYLDLNRVTLVGGLAIRHHLTRFGIPYPIRPLNDIDFIADDVSAISAEVTNNFLVYHHHPPPENGDYFMKLVDPVSRTKVDFFRRVLHQGSNHPVQFEAHQVYIAGVEDQLVSTTIDAYEIVGGKATDPKHFDDMRLLMQISNMEIADQYWKSQPFYHAPTAIAEAIKQAEQTAIEHPDRLLGNPYRRPLPYECGICIHSPDFPIAPMAEVYRILGYLD